MKKIFFYLILIFVVINLYSEIDNLHDVNYDKLDTILYYNDELEKLQVIYLEYESEKSGLIDKAAKKEYALYQKELENLKNQQEQLVKEESKKHQEELENLKKEHEDFKKQQEQLVKEESKKHQEELENLRKEQEQFAKESIEKFIKEETARIRSEALDQLTKDLTEKIRSSLTEELSNQFRSTYELKKNSELKVLKSNLRKEILQKERIWTIRIYFIVIAFIFLVFAIFYFILQIMIRSSSQIYFRAIYNREKTVNEIIKEIEQLKKGRTTQIIALKKAEKKVNRQRKISIKKAQSNFVSEYLSLLLKFGDASELYNSIQMIDDPFEKEVRIEAFEKAKEKYEKQQNIKKVDQLQEELDELYRDFDKIRSNWNANKDDEDLKDGLCSQLYSIGDRFFVWKRNSQDTFLFSSDYEKTRISSLHDQYKNSLNTMISQIGDLKELERKGRKRMRVRTLDKIIKKYRKIQ